MDELMSGAVELMVQGMGVVFGFLILLVGATSVMSRIVRSIAPDAPAPSRPVSGSTTAAVDPRVRRAIELAISQHRRRRD